MLGYETTVVNGQMVNVAPGQSFAPLTFGSTYTGPGYWPRNGVYNVPPVTPSPSTMAGQSAMPTQSGGYGGNQPTPTAGTMSQSGNTNYFHGTKSPLIWALLFLGGGLAMLHFIHYK